MLLPPSEASHSTEDTTIIDNFWTTSRISGLLIASWLKHQSAISAICNQIERKIMVIYIIINFFIILIIIY